MSHCRWLSRSASDCSRDRKWKLGLSNRIITCFIFFLSFLLYWIVMDRSLCLAWMDHPPLAHFPQIYRKHNLCTCGMREPRNKETERHSTWLHLKWAVNSSTMLIIDYCDFCHSPLRCLFKIPFEYDWSWTVYKNALIGVQTPPPSSFLHSFLHSYLPSFLSKYFELCVKEIFGGV